MEEHKTSMKKTKFARVCVEIDAEFQFSASILVRLGYGVDVVKASYKWIPKSCSKCLNFGPIVKTYLSVGVLQKNGG